MSAEILVMCGGCGRPQAPAPVCRECGHPLPSSPAGPSAESGGLRQDSARVFALGARGSLRLSAQALELCDRGVTLDQAKVGELRSLRLVRRPLLPSVLLLSLGVLGALLLPEAGRPVAAIAAVLGVVGLLGVQRYVVRLERQDRSGASLELGVLSRGTSRRLAVERAWREATPSLRAAGVPVEEAR